MVNKDTMSPLFGLLVIEINATAFGFSAFITFQSPSIRAKKGFVAPVASL